VHFYREWFNKYPFCTKVADTSLRQWRLTTKMQHLHA
jgi:hypothetical protein